MHKCCVCGLEIQQAYMQCPTCAKHYHAQCFQAGKGCVQESCKTQQKALIISDQELNAMQPVLEAIEKFPVVSEADAQAYVDDKAKVLGISGYGWGEMLYFCLGCYIIFCGLILTGAILPEMIPVWLGWTMVLSPMAALIACILRDIASNREQEAIEHIEQQNLMAGEERIKYITDKGGLDGK